MKLPKTAPTREPENCRLVGQQLWDNPDLLGQTKEKQHAAIQPSIKTRVLL